MRGSFGRAKDMIEFDMGNLQAPWLLGGIAGSLVIVLAAVLFVHLRKTREKRRLQKLLQENVQDVISEVVIPDGLDGFLFADYLILHHNQVLVMNVKQKHGYVFGGEKIHEWTCVKNHVTEKFNNPLESVNMFAQAITHNLKFPDVRGYVLFDSQSDFAKGVPPGVLQLDTFELMLEQSAVEETSEAVQEFWQQLKALTQDAKANAEH